MSTLSREKIVEELINILGADQVVTDEAVLKESSLDRYRKFEQCHKVYTLPTPAAVIYVHNTDEVAKVTTRSMLSRVQVSLLSRVVLKL